MMEASHLVTIIPSAPCDRGFGVFAEPLRLGGPPPIEGGIIVKKLISMLVAICLLLALFACSNADQEAIYSSALAEGKGGVCGKRRAIRAIYGPGQRG